MSDMRVKLLIVVIFCFSMLIVIGLARHLDAANAREVVHMLNMQMKGNACESI